VAVDLLVDRSTVEVDVDLERIDGPDAAAA
jgi:hypothetical protein